MTITEDDLTTALRRLHQESHPERQPGEFTIFEYAKAAGLTVKKASAELTYMAQTGEVEKPPKRYIDGNLRVVYRIADVT